MAFTIAESRKTFKRTVRCQIPSDKLDTYKEQSFVAEYRLLDNDQVKEMADSGDTVKAQLDRILVSVEGVGNESGEPMAQEAALEAIKQHTIASLAALYEFNQTMSKDILGKTAKTSSAK